MAFVRSKVNKQGVRYYELVKSVRKGDRVEQKFLKYIGTEAQAREYCGKEGVKFPGKGKPNLDEQIAKEKGKLDGLRPFPRVIANKLREELEYDWIYNSNAIEGNTLTYKQTVSFLETGETVRGRPIKDYREAENHKRAIAFAYELAGEKRLIKEADIKHIQALLVDGTMRPEFVGRYRKVRAYIRNQPGERLTKPTAIPGEMRKLINYLNKNPDKLSAIDLAARVHWRLVAIHPFADGNGRTARVLTNVMIMRAGYPPVVVKLRDRSRYFPMIRKARKGESLPLHTLFKRKVLSEMKFYIKNLT